MYEGEEGDALVFLCIWGVGLVRSRYPCEIELTPLILLVHSPLLLVFLEGFLTSIVLVGRAIHTHGTKVAFQ